MDDSPKKKLLVVEDDQMLRDLYLDILTDAGYEVDSAEDGAQGYEKLHQGGYDLVLLDIMLPHMDGLSILAKLNHEPSEKLNKAIVVLSNLGQDAAIAQATSLGARGYMIKSDHTPDQVVAEVKRVLEETGQ